MLRLFHAVSSPWRVNLIMVATVLSRIYAWKRISDATHAAGKQCMQEFALFLDLFSILAGRCGRALPLPPFLAQFCPLGTLKTCVT